MSSVQAPINCFGDVITEIEDVKLNARIKYLKKILSELVLKQKELSGYFEPLFAEMISGGKAQLIIKLSRWLSNQSDVALNEIESLSSEKALLDVFEKSLMQFSQELLLSHSMRNSCIIEVYVSQLFPALGDITIPISAIHQESHHANHVDMVYVCGIAKTINSKKIFEFGTYRGQTTCGLASVCRGAHVFTLNLPPELDARYAQYIGSNIAKSPDKSRITQLFCDSKSFDTSPYAKSMDYIFIDADHSYEGVKSDTQKALEMLKPGGIIVWHDYAAKSPGVIEYINKLSHQLTLFRIKKTCLVVYVDGIDINSVMLNTMDDTLEEEEYSTT
jgi:predicted O-methyltransferase YrrM